MSGAKGYSLAIGGDMTLANQRLQVARPTHENSLAIGIVGTAFLAVGGVNVIGLYAIEPDNPSDLEIVEHRLFAESELEELLG